MKLHMLKVMELAGDLAVERRAERATVIQKTFKKIINDETSHSAPKKSKYGLDASASKPLKSPFAEPKPKRLGEDLPENSRPPKLLAKDKQMILIKAQLTIAPESVKNPLDMLNYACSRAKVSWKLEDANGRVYLTVADVLVASLYSKDPTTARAAATKEAVTKLRSVCLEVREGGYKQGSIKLGLFTSQDRRLGWTGPEENVFAAQEAALAEMREGLMEAKGGMETSPETTLWKVAELCGNHLKEEAVAKSGWNQTVEVKLCDVIVWKGTVKGKESPEEARARATSIANLLSRPHQRVYEDSEGRLRLIASDKPISDDEVRKALTGPQPS